MERGIGERDIMETAATGQFAEELLIHMHIGGVSCWLNFSLC
jgi:hypothetical protein